MANKDFNYKTLNLEQMKDYIEKNAPQDKSWFKKVAMVDDYPKTTVYLYNDDGSPKMKISKKTGEAYHAKEIIPDRTKAPKGKVFSLLDAKKAFIERYMPELKPAKKEKKSNFLEDW